MHILNTYNDWIRTHTDNCNYFPYLLDKGFKELGVLYIISRSNVSLHDLLVENTTKLSLSNYHPPSDTIISDMVFANHFHEKKHYNEIYPFYPNSNFNLTYQECTSFPPFTLSHNLNVYDETIQLNFVDAPNQSFYIISFEDYIATNADRREASVLCDIIDVDIHYCHKYIQPFGDIIIPTMDLKIFNNSVREYSRLHFPLYNYFLSFFLSHYVKQYVSDVEFQL